MGRLATERGTTVAGAGDEGLAVASEFPASGGVASELESKSIIWVMAKSSGETIKTL